MNKKILGIRVGTLLAMFGCVFAAVAIWILAKYHNGSLNSAIHIANLFRG